LGLHSHSTTIAIPRTKARGTSILHRQYPAAYDYISALIPSLNSNYGNPNRPDPFAANSDAILNEQYAANGDSSLIPFTIVGNQQYTNYNFAVARVRLQGTAGTTDEAKNVSVL
jgi:hypothetical protein